MIRYTKDTFMYSPWVFAMSPRSIEQLKETSESSNKVSSLLLHYEHILESADQELSDYYEELQEKEEETVNINQLSASKGWKKKADTLVHQQTKENKEEDDDDKEEKDPIGPFLSLLSKLTDEIGTLKNKQKVDIRVDQIQIQVLNEKNADNLTNRSFFRIDLQRVLKDLDNLKANCPIKKYLRTACGEYTTYSRWYTKEHLEELLLNQEMVRWPSPFSPALMQQAAINLGSHLGEIDKVMSNNDNYTNVFSVNGPPGTGKTTLLKDIIASYVYERAH